MNIKEILKYCIWAGIGAVLVVPFFVADGMFFPYITGKGFAFRIIVEIIFGLWLILVIKDKEFRPKWSWVLGAAGILTFVLLLADINAVLPSIERYISAVAAYNPISPIPIPGIFLKPFWSNFERMEGWVTFIHLLAYLLVLSSMLNTEKLWLWFFRFTIVSPVFYVGYEYFAYLKELANSPGNTFSLAGLMQYMGLVGDRWSGPLGNTIYLGVMALFFACFCLLLIYHDVIGKKKEKNVLSSVYSGVLYLVMITTFCLVVRAMHVGLIGSGIVWWLALVIEIALGLIIIAISFRQQLFQARFAKSVFFSPSIYSYSILFCLYFYILATTSRGVLLGFAGGILIASLLIAIFEKNNLLLKRIAAGIFALFFVLGLFYSVFVFRDTAVYKKMHLSGVAVRILDTDFVKHNSALNRLLSVSWSNLNGQARQLVWPMAIKGFQEKPLLGWGQEGFNYVFNKYYDPGMYAQESWFDRAHNAPLDFLVAAGILGFLSYLALFGAALYLLWFRKNSLSVTERAILTGLFTGYLFQAIFVFDNLVSYIMFFTTLAYVHARAVEQEENKKAFRFMSDFISNEEYQNYVLIPAVVILTAVCLWWVNIPGIRANQTLIQGLNFLQNGQIGDGITAFKKALSYNSMGQAEIREQLLSLTPSVLQSPNVSQDIKKELFTLTYTEIGKQIALVPNDARYQILMGSLLDGIGSPDQALPYIKKAIELSPQKQAMRFELVQALYMLGRKNEALAEAKAAYELDTRYDQAKGMYEAVLKGVTGK